MVVEVRLFNLWLPPFLTQVVEISRVNNKSKYSNDFMLRFWISRYNISCNIFVSQEENILCFHWQLLHETSGVCIQSCILHFHILKFYSIMSYFLHCALNALLLFLNSNWTENPTWFSEWWKISSGCRKLCPTFSNKGTHFQLCIWLVHDKIMVHDLLWICDICLGRSFSILRPFSIVWASWKG